MRKTALNALVRAAQRRFHGRAARSAPGRLQRGNGRLNASRQLLAIAEADKKAVEAQRTELDLRLARAEIKAPTGGIISRRMIRIGSIASMAQDSMFRIIENGDVELLAEVTEGDLPRLKLGQKGVRLGRGFGPDDQRERSASSPRK